MTVLFFGLIALFLIFNFVVLFGAPYLPTLKQQSESTFKLLGLRPGETMLELGCGDGRMLKLAAQKGYRAIGYELNPLLALVAVIRTWKYRKQVQVVCGNFWHKEWPEAAGIFVFLLDRFMPKLDKYIVQYKHKPVKLVSFAFEIPGKKPVKKQDGLFLYQYDK